MTEIIYESRGRAREYSELAANLYKGCDHGCSYCYVPRVTRQARDAFLKPSVRDDVLNRFLNDAIKLEKKGEKRFILLSFTTDPYMHLDETVQLTREAIKILLTHNLRISILTKGGRRSERDFDLLASQPDRAMYGASLVFTDEEMRKAIEPNAAPTKERIEALKKAHDMGIFTYVSLEPVWSPEQSLEIIDRTHEFVDHYKAGKLNYNAQQRAVDWSKYHKDVVALLESYDKDYYIKKDLRRY